MDDQTARLLLTEFRAFRHNKFRVFNDGVSESKQDTGERIAQPETQVKSAVTGNGQASRLQLVERSVDSLNRFRYWLLGAAADLSAIFHYILPGGRQ